MAIFETFNKFTTGQQFDIGGSIVGGLFQALGQFNEGQAFAQSAEQQARINQFNASLARRAAADRLFRGMREVQAQQVAREQTIGQAQATFAGRNIVVDQDSALDHILDIIRTSKLDEITLRDNARIEAENLRLQAQADEFSAQFLRQQAADSRRAGFINAAGTLIGTAGSVARKWFTFQDEIEPETFGDLGGSGGRV